jgi:pyruvate formate lyase activating enzyme
MKIAYLQKMSLQDFPDTVSCIVFLSGCSFRCGMCYNSMILDSEFSGMSEEEFFSFLESRKKQLDGVVVTGGEPLIHKELIEFLKKIKEKGMKIKLDTNGSNPERLKEVIDLRLVDYVAMDIKSAREDYEKVAGVKVDLGKIEESMRILAKSNIEHEYRTTLCPIEDNGKYRAMDENDIEKIAEWISSIDGDASYYLQAFLPEKERLVNKKLEEEKKTRGDILLKAKENALKFLKRVYLRE